MKDYEVKIRETSKDLSARERIAIKDTTNAASLDAETADGELMINLDYYAILDVHNERSESKDYTKIVLVDKGGAKFYTGSDSFIRALEGIVEEMTEAGEGDDIQIIVYRKESKNYKGKSFITCSLA